MSVVENKSLVARLLSDVFNTGDTERIGDFVSNELAGGGKSYIDERRRLFPDLQYVIEEQIAEGDKVVTRCSMRGTNWGTLHDGQPATGKQMKTSMVLICRIEEGKIVDLWMLLDHSEVREQLGIS